MSPTQPIHPFYLPEIREALSLHECAVRKIWRMKPIFVFCACWNAREPKFFEVDQKTHTEIQYFLKKEEALSVLSRVNKVDCPRLIERVGVIDEFKNIFFLGIERFNQSISSLAITLEGPIKINIIV